MNEPSAMLLMSGPLAVGKTAVRDELVSKYGFAYLRSSEYLRAEVERAGLRGERAVLQELGDRLDEETDYRWLIDSVALPAMKRAPDSSRWVVDAVRKKRQVEHFRDAFAGGVFHVHFTADESILVERYQARQRSQGVVADPTPYDSAIDHDNERSARSLDDVADMLVDLGKCSASGAAEAIVSALSQRALARPIGTKETG